MANPITFRQEIDDTLYDAGMPPQQRLRALVLHWSMGAQEVWKRSGEEQDPEVRADLIAQKLSLESCARQLAEAIEVILPEVPPVDPRWDYFQIEAARRGVEPIFSQSELQVISTKLEQGIRSMVRIGKLANYPASHGIWLDEQGTLYVGGGAPPIDSSFRLLMTVGEALHRFGGDHG